MGVASVTYSIQRVAVRANPAREGLRFVWPTGVLISAAGRISATVEMQDSSVEHTTFGLFIRGYDRSTVTGQITDLRLDSLPNDGIHVQTGFPCSGRGSAFSPNCARLAPAPVSDARVVLHVDRLRFTDTLGVGQPNGAGVIEMVANDQGRSTIEIHVQRSDITGAAAAGIYTFYFSGRPGKDVIDFGCVNPDPAGTSPDPAACRRAGYTSIGQNRIFGNSRRSKTHTPLGEIALQGPGAMMAQGNYFGDIAPADGKGDALGECHVMPWPTDPRNEPPPARLIPNARCELYDIPGQGKPTGIDARFHLATDPRPPNTVIGKVLGHYRVTAKLGAGGMGEVYRARDEHLDRDVALKVLPPGTLGDDTARRRFRREAEALSRLNHAHIATVHDFDSSDGIDFLVMEYVPGQTLSERIAAGPLPEKDIVSLGADIAAALEEAHERGVVHRDLKPANIIVMPKGRVKVLDFGLAQLSGTAADVEQTTTRSDSGFEGTLPYMAPEQVRGEAVDSRTDVYALGVVLYEAATGRRPFDDTQTGRLTDAILHQPVMPPAQLLPRVNPEIERIILKCLERDPENRYQSAKEVAIDLRRLGSPTTHQTASRAVRPGIGETGSPLDWRRLAVALTAVVFWLGQRNQVDPPVATTADGIASIVALPSKVVAQASDHFLTDAIPNTISAHLTQVKGLETKMPPSSVEVERVRGDLGKLADMYGVSAFVLTSLTADTDRLVLNVQLVEARSRRLMWSRDFEGRRDGYLALARSAAEELRGVVRPQATPVDRADARRRTRKRSSPTSAACTTSTATTTSTRRRTSSRVSRPSSRRCRWNRGWQTRRPASPGCTSSRSKRALRSSRRCRPCGSGRSARWRWTNATAGRGRSRSPSSSLPHRAGRATRWPRRCVRPAMGHATRLRSTRLRIALYSICSSLALASVQEAGRQDPLYLYAALNASELLVYLNRPAEALAYADNVLRVEADMPVALIRKALALIELERLGRPGGSDPDPPAPRRPKDAPTRSRCRW